MRWFFGLLIAAAFTLPSQLRYNANVTGSVSRPIASKEGDVVSAKDYCSDTIPANATACLQAAINATPIGGELRFPAGTYALGSSLTITKSIVMQGAGREAVVIVAPSGGAIFSPSGTFLHWRISRLTLKGNGAGSQVMTTVYPTVVFGEGRFTLEDCIVQLFGAMALNIGNSFYMLDFQRNAFNQNAGSLTIGQNSDAYLSDNYFSAPVAGNPQLVLSGTNVRVIGNSFLRGGNALGTVTTEPDILIKPLDANANSSFIYISHNSFRSDLEVNTRPKIQHQGATATWTSIYVTINNNFFDLVSGQKAIILNNPPSRWMIRDNNFHLRGAATMVDDVFPVVNANDVGQSIFEINRVSWAIANPVSYTTFTNGGRGFKINYLPNTASEETFDDRPRLNEMPELRNRIPFSEAFESWGAGGVSVTTGQADPWGTTRARLLTRANAAAGEQVNSTFNTTGAGTRVFIKWWARGGTATSFILGVYDNTAGGFIGEQLTYNLPTIWKQYKTVINGITPANSSSIFIYPVNQSQSAGTMYITAMQVSDYDSDYYPTTGAMASDTTSGNRWERKVQAAGGATIGTGLGADGGGFKHKRVAVGCTTGAAIGAACTSAALSWTTAFADANYTIACTLTNPTGQPHISSVAQIAASFTVTIAADTAVGATATVDCVAVHD